MLKIDAHAESAGKGHLRDRDCQTSFAQVVAGADRAGMNGGVDGGERAPRDIGVDLRHVSAAQTMHAGKVRSAQLVFCRADQVDPIAGFLEVHRYGVRHVVDLSQRTDQ